MVDVRPFKAFEYATEKVDLGSVVAPPFDVLDAAQTKALQKASPYNVTHLTVSQGKTNKGKMRKATSSTYAKVEKRLLEWVEGGTLVPRKEDCMYAYEARYSLDGKERRLRGVVLLLRLDPEYRQVVPHERIFEKPMEERLGLLKGTAWDLEPIELMYSGESAEGAMWAYIDGSGRTPDLVATGPDGTQHLYWRLTDQAVISTIVHGFKGRKAYIADGHHRYATHVAYAKDRRSSEYRPPKDSPYDFKMCVLVNAADSGLAILPTHRIVSKAVRSSAKEVLSAVSEHFDLVRLDGSEPVRRRVEAFFARAERPTVAVYFGEDEGLVGLTAKAPAMAESAAPGRSFPWRMLDVSFLQHLVVGQGFGVPQEAWGDDVQYTQDWEESVKAVDAGKAAAVAFHRPVTAKQLRAVADAGEVMPQKSTYFVPKLLSGMAFHRIGKEPAGRELRRPTS